MPKSRNSNNLKSLYIAWVCVFVDGLIRDSGFNAPLFNGEIDEKLQAYQSRTYLQKLGGKGGGGGGGGGKGAGSGGSRCGGKGGGGSGTGGRSSGTSSSSYGLYSGSSGGSMKAPGGRGAYISRDAFENDPKGYFNQLHAKGK
ncbi:PREDICTED: LOW QUALITY PROTEIN: glycine-rich protein DOT1 [Nelumbo nucifera]|uniref:LOW QUALITY PROTEIN: glycine-rich protein DOT1 n=1 Tax=Nelumbo nucifera TaxID=4432 RepID=A0A1U8BKV6_NELNU|nr:PREDICTED: LOW QUALITY PROTEIN: glycine-rich protein DOT1 [Nelumbo nucifera]